MRIPQTDPKANYLAHKQEIDSAVARVLESGRYILGPEVELFEREFAAYLGARHAIGVASGTGALHLALKACGIAPGDRVATVSHTATATVAAIEAAEAVPVLVDIDPATFTMDCGQLEQTIGGVRAVVPVHLYGHPADMPRVMELARRHGVKVIEDSAQAHGASIGGRKIWGDAAAFSFYPTKNLGAMGDGGAIATNDPEIAAGARMLRQYGWKTRYVSDVPGINSRLDELQAAILRVKLRYLDQENSRRTELAAAYSEALAAADLILPQCSPGAAQVYHQYVVRSKRRDALQRFLAERGAGTLVHYPVPVHLQPAYRGRIEHGRLSVTEAMAGEILSLPMFAELSFDQAREVAELCRVFGPGK